jgi:uncharacterized protein
MVTYFIVPGLGGSGPTHWQTYFEQSGSHFRRIEQQDWNTPVCADWVEAIQQALSGYDPATVVLVAHSLGCIAVAHWANAYPTPIKGAMLVAPSDIEAPAYDFGAAGFAPIPLNRLPFPSMVVASTTDVWVTLGRARFFAEAWGSELVNIGAAGHINVESGHTRWDEGLQLLKRLG